MSPTFGCWFTLSEADKSLCFDAKSGPKRLLQYQGQKLCAWPVAGKLREEWNRVAEQVKARTETINFQRLISPAKPNHATVRWVLYLAGKVPDPGSLLPIIVAESADIEIAKRACKALQDMKKHSLAPLLGSYGMHFAQVQIRLRAEPTEVVSPLPSDADDRSSLCGQQILISSHFGAEAPAFTTSTLGGAIIVGRTCYGLTAAHAFPEHTPHHQTRDEHAHVRTESQDQLDGSFKSNTHVADSATSPPTLRYLVYVQKCDGGVIDPETLSIPDPPPPDISKASLINSVSHRVIFNRSQDWALVPIENDRFLRENKFTSPDGTVTHITGITEDIPPGPVVIATGVSDPAFSSVSETTSLLLLPGCEQPQIVWSAEKHSAPGDCGSWVITQNSQACAMVIAASEDDDEIYCLPLAPIFRDVQEQMGSEREPTLPLDEYDLFPNLDRDSSSDRLHDGQPPPANGLSSSTARTSNGTTSGTAPIRQDLSGTDDNLTDTDTPNLTTKPRQGKPRINTKPTMPGILQNQATSMKNTSASATAADKETAKPAEAEESSAGQSSQVDKENPALPSNGNPEVIETEQYSQNKRAATATVSFQSPGHEPSSPALHPNHPVPPPGARPKSPIIKPARPYYNYPPIKDLSPYRYKDPYVETEREYQRVPAAREVGRTPDFVREDYGRPPVGPTVIHARRDDGFESRFPRPRPRSPSPPSPVPARRADEEETIIVSDSRSYPAPRHFVERVIYPPREGETDPSRDEIILQRLEDLRRSYPASPRLRERELEISPPREEIIIRRDEDDDRSRYASDLRGIRRDTYDGQFVKGTSNGQEIVVRREGDRSFDRAPPRRERSKERTRIRPRPLPQLAEHPFHDADHIEMPHRSSYRSSGLHGSSRIAFTSLDLKDTTVVSRREILPAVLDEAGIQWDWQSPYDDYMIRVAPVGDNQMRQLREKTQRILNQNLAPNPRSTGRAYTINTDINTDHRHKSRTDEAVDAMFGEVVPVRTPQVGSAIQKVEARYRKQVEKQNSIDSDCRILDLEFEGMVQNLFWDAKLSPETCDILVKLHQEKEAKIKAHAQERLQSMATLGTKGEGEDAGREDKSALRTCPMKLEVDGVLVPCGEAFKEEDALRKHEVDHLVRAPYHVKDVSEFGPALPPRLPRLFYPGRDQDAVREWDYMLDRK